MTGQKWGRPAAGREPAAAALLAWLADPAAPRLCVVTGGEEAGKSQLLAWLVAHGIRPDTPPERRVHGFAPLSGGTTTIAAWTLAQQLSLAARTPGELVSALDEDARRTVLVFPDLHAAEDPDVASDFVLHLLRHEHMRLIVEVRSGCPEAAALTAAGPAVMDLDDARWTDTERQAAWSSSRPQRPGAREPEREAGAVEVDLSDPAAVCGGDPWRISALFEQSEDGHGGLRAAWFRAGSSLTRATAAADRALTLLAALGDDADPRLPDGLAGLAAGAAWELVWRRVRGDVNPPWPGPVRAVAAGRGALAGTLVVADHQGTVRVVDAQDGAPRGRLASPVGLLRGVSVCGDGTVLVLGEHGRLDAHRAAAAARASGIAALLEPGSGPLERLLDAVNGEAGGPVLTAAAASESVLAVADENGAVRVLAADGTEDRQLTARVHEAGVAALALAEVPSDEGDGSALLVYSGGGDGRVRVWQPGADPLSPPVVSRPCPVTDLAAVHVPDSGLVMAVGWADGLVEYLCVDSGEVHAFRPGPPVRAVALTREGLLVVGTDETIVCLRPT